MSDELLSPKELATALRRSIRYVYYMKANGFLMPGGRATLRMALNWLVRNPPPRSKINRNVQNSALA